VRTPPGVTAGRRPGSPGGWPPDPCGFLCNVPTVDYQPVAKGMDQNKAGWFTAWDVKQEPVQVSRLLAVWARLDRSSPAGGRPCPPATVATLATLGW
jgi:hypothetical protein